MKDLKEVFESRRSVNYFDDKRGLDDGTIKKIINLATLSPSCYNLQPWEVIVIKSDHYKKRLYNEACKQEKVLKAPVTLAIIGDILGYRRHNKIWDEKIKNGLSKDRMEKIIKNNDEAKYNTLEKKFAFGARNSSLFAMSIMYSAKYYGVDSHPMIGFDEEKVKDIFNIDDNKIVNMLISLGYYDEKKELKPREKRFDYNVIAKEY